MDLKILPYIYSERFQETPKLVHLDNQLELDEMFERHSLPRVIRPWERWLLGVSSITRVEFGAIGFVEIRSTLGRAGFFSPPTYADPLFEGNLTLEMWNGNRYHEFMIEPNMELFSLAKVMNFDEPKYVGRYQNQVGITLPKALVR